MKYSCGHLNLASSQVSDFKKSLDTVNSASEEVLLQFLYLFFVCSISILAFAWVTSLVAGPELPQIEGNYEENIVSREHIESGNCQR